MASATVSITPVLANPNPASVSAVTPFSITGTIQPVVTLAAPTVVTISVVNNSGIYNIAATSITVPTGAVGVIITPPAAIGTMTGLMLAQQTANAGAGTRSLGMFIPMITPSHFMWDTNAANVPTLLYLACLISSSGNCQFLFY